MKTNLPAHEEHRLPADVRMTPQRREIYEVLRMSHDHPTATEILNRAKERIPGISLATVYNCLETLTGHGLVRQVNVDRSCSRYCANLEDHVHFYCESCGAVVDAPPLEDVSATRLWKLPMGSSVTRLDVAIHGLCPDCTTRQQTSPPPTLS